MFRHKNKRFLERMYLFKCQTVIKFLDTCTCSTPGAGTTGKNEMTCSNGETRHCVSDEECYATIAFIYGQWKDGCRIPGNFILDY